MIRLPWKAGSCDAGGGAVVVSATRFTFTRLRDLPGVFLAGLRLRRQWSAMEGAIGLSMAGRVLRRTTYTISVWRSEAELRRFLGSPAHQRLVRRYRGRVESSAAAQWQVETFDLAQAWNEARRRQL
ncbi:MAG: hypothetical protein P4L83_04695 [Nevskia sp.]|nr:hypothetical protein [Nevskia sp.]